MDGNSGAPIPDSEVPDFINNYFSTIGSTLAENLSKNWVYNGIQSDNVIQNITTDIVEVAKLVNDIDVNKSSAIDYISSRVIKDIFSNFPEIVVKIFNTSLRTGLVPESWKSATVIPLKKEGNSPDVNNLRPISLLPIQWKLLDKIVHTRLMSHFDDNNLLDIKQGGFRQNHSTIDTTVKFTEDLYKNINQGLTTVAAFIDFRKAFDTVNHTILVNKLEYLGIKGDLLSWIRNYLTDRKQCVVANNCTSSNAKVTRGVPQGSVLGPLLFLAYINDLKSFLERSNHFLYADNTVIYCSGNNQHQIKQNLQADLNKFNSWCKGYKLTINTKKSNIVSFGTKKRLAKFHNPILYLNNEKLDRVSYYKYLGVYMDSTLTFNKHIDNTRKLIGHKLYLLSRIRRYVDEYTSICIFKSMIAPILDYGDIIYAGTSSCNLDKLQSLQNRGLRICTNENYYIPKILLHQRCLVPNLKTRRTYNLRKYMYKQQDNVDIVVNRNIQTRRHDAIVYETSIPLLEKYKKGAIYRGIQEWNNLTVDTRNIDSFQKFRTVQKKWMYDMLFL